MQDQTPDRRVLFHLLVAILEQQRPIVSLMNIEPDRLVTGRSGDPAKGLRSERRRKQSTVDDRLTRVCTTNTAAFRCQNQEP